jgi:membrane-anchored glycerophosphoryl diester phosphodiesterase (GDPDase)
MERFGHLSNTPFLVETTNEVAAAIKNSLQKKKKKKEMTLFSLLPKF